MNVCIVLFARSLAKCWKQLWFALFNNVIAYERQFLHNFDVSFFFFKFDLIDVDECKGNYLPAPVFQNFTFN